MKSHETDPAAARLHLRKAMIAARLAVAPADIAAWSAAICRHLQQRFTAPPGRRIAFCWPVNHEADLRPLLAGWRAAGAVTCLPVVVDENAPLAFRAWVPGDPMVDDRYGIPTPAAGNFVVPEVMLLPLNAFDDAGFRLGYGGGFFDRTLAALTPRPLTIGVGFEIGRVDSVVPQAHDAAMDWIVTERGVRQIR